MQLPGVAARLKPMKAEIREYQSSDKADVRRIARTTAEGYPNPDTEMVADLLTGYYVDYEPEHLLVVEKDREVVGYLAGCFNTDRCRWVKGTRIIPRTIFKALFRGEIGLRELRYLASFLYVAAHGGTRNSPPDGYPAHFHINLVQKARGEGVGTKLAKKYLRTLKEAGIGGVHVRVRQNEGRASNFFMSLGFSRQNGYPTLMFDDGEIQTSRSIIYTKDL